MDRIITAVTFILVGPPAGALWLWCCFFGLNLSHGEPDAYSIALESLPIVLAISYPAGFLPAFVTSFIFASLPTAWQRVFVALPIGALATCLFWELAKQVLGEGRGTPNPQGVIINYVVLVSAGAAAAAISALIAQLVIKRFARQQRG